MKFFKGYMPAKVLRNDIVECNEVVRKSRWMVCMLEPVYHTSSRSLSYCTQIKGTKNYALILVGSIHNNFHGEKVLNQTHFYTERAWSLFCDQMERDWCAVIAMGDGRSVFPTPRKRHLFSSFNGINIGRCKHIHEFSEM